MKALLLAAALFMIPASAMADTKCPAPLNLHLREAMAMAKAAAPNGVLFGFPESEKARNAIWLAQLNKVSGKGVPGVATKVFLYGYDNAKSILFFMTDDSDCVRHMVMLSAEDFLVLKTLIESAPI
jgi:hypothetical protein